MQKLKEPFWLITYGLVLFFFLLHIESFSNTSQQFLNLISPFLWGFALAYVLNVPYEFFLHKVFKLQPTHPRYGQVQILSLFISYAIFFLSVTFIMCMLIPQIVESINLFIDNSSNYYIHLQLYLNELISKLNMDETIWKEIQKAMMSLADLLKNLLPSFVSFVTNAASSLINIICSIIVSIYILGSKEKLMNLVSRSIKVFTSTKLQERLKHIADVTDHAFRGFIIGQLTNALIIGIITFIGASLLGCPYPVLIGFIAGITNIIPVVGPIIGAVPCILIILMVNPSKLILYIIFIIILQQIDGNLICPIVVGDSTGLDGLWILFAVIVGGGFFGIVGCLLSVPVFAIFFTLYDEFLDRKLQSK